MVTVAFIAGRLASTKRRPLSQAAADRRFHLRRRLEARQARHFGTVLEQGKSRRLPQAQATEKLLAHHFQLHLEQCDACCVLARGELGQRHVEHLATRAIVLVIVDK
ncbi:hypothetical protein XAP6164_3000011 [Xanthomonas phaseoli pv. phaseoli]|uniref:Uncharacterized protein n=1 Tax=Xanthomonas campestris pv. phaseoli TaxID=317013 RepID=A0AB38E450_XANCH|nr:hypothetical protein XAP6984_750013 [Xanthomonas phaseoli pv. phaseoli]SON92143.1 hypothetical protein XAP7430_710013 [Xanthomonas phaseoli pv. phaseoli]SOO28992.1 hypothetical protein XAP6164_3000011 [Xanthomonas phaseoli pv. phaseoli]